MQKTVKNIFLRTVGTLSGAVPFRFLQQRAANQLLLPFYHTISDAPLPHIQHLYAPRTVQAFRADLDFLLKNYEPVDLQTIIARTRENQPFEKPSFHLSFDDGLREFYTVVAPVLREKGIPATVFLNSAFVDNKALMFRYKYSLIQAKKAMPHLANITYKNSYILDEVAQELGIDFNDFLQKSQPYLTTVQIQELAKQGFTFGAHSHDHPEFRQLSLADQLQQAHRSIDFVQQLLPEQTFRTFAFPFNDVAVSLAFFNELNFDLSFGCAGTKNDTAPRHLQRVVMERGHIAAKQIIATEYLYYLALKCLKKSIILRK